MKLSSSLPYLTRVAHLLGCVLLLVCVVGCKPATTIRGDLVDEGGIPVPAVVDRESKALPGVAVTVAGTDVQAVTDAIGQYRLNYCPPGKLMVTFEKTGYTPAKFHVSVGNGTVMDAPTVTLWRLPANKGLFAYFDYQYTPLERSVTERFLVKEEEKSNPKTVFGLRSVPILILQESRPLIIGYKTPAYDLRLDKLMKVTAALPQRPGASLPPAKAYDQEIWVEKERLSLRTLALDEPERLLYALDWEADLEPGEVYALHWGALEGLRTEEKFVFVFQYLSPMMVAEMEAAEATALAEAAALAEAEEKAE